MTVQHYLISRFGVCAAWAKLYRVIARDIIRYGTFAFLLSNTLKQINSEIKFGWLKVFSDNKLASIVRDKEVASNKAYRI